MKRLNLTFLLLIIANATLLIANPIIIDLSEAKAIKSSEDLSIQIEGSHSSISGVFTYRQIPNFRSEKLEDYHPNYITMILPVYRSSDPNKRNVSTTPRIESRGVIYEVEEVHHFSGPISKKKRGVLWDVPKGYEVAFYASKIPLSVISDGNEIRASYKQDHIHLNGKDYLLYTPYFEEAQVWKGIQKDMKDFSIWITTSPGISFDVKPDVKEFLPIGHREKGFLIWPEHLRHIKIEIKKADHTPLTK